MHTMTRTMFVLGLALAPVLFAAPAQAQLYHTWVASTVAGGNNGWI